MNPKDSNIALLLYAIVLVMLSFVGISFVYHDWSWGLMDDYNLLTVPGSVWERTTALFKSMLANGRFQPTYNFYAASFYHIFEHAPKLFYILHAGIVCLSLVVWGYVAYLFTNSRLAFPLFICVSLSFYKFYDSFFYLSVQEILGLLFAGCACVFNFKAFSGMINNASRISWPNAVCGLLFLIISFCTKETFLVVGLAWGVSLLFCGFWFKRNGMILLCGAVLLLLSLSYGIILKAFIVTGYSSAYSFSNFTKIGGNILNWVQVDLLGHSPWLFLGFLLLVFRLFYLPLNNIRRCGIVLSIVLYIGYLLVLLPWLTLGHYTIPLAVFFAFSFTLLMSAAIERVHRGVGFVLAGGIWVLNLWVAVSAFQVMTTYQADTANLMKWMANNAQFQYELKAGANARANACEPAERIPQFTNSYYGTTVPSFIFTTGVRDIMADPKTAYFLYGTTWGDQDLSRIPNLWYPVFISKTWVLFRRLI